jgi:cytochrome c553
MKRKFFWFGVGIILFQGTFTVMSDENQDDFQSKVKICTTCHGPDGNSTAPNFPKIAGQSVKYLQEQLLEYRKGNQGKRFEPIMYGMTQNLSDQDILDLAVFYASQKATGGKARPEDLELGEKIYRAGNPKTGVPACMACHGPEGEGNELAKFPKLSGQFPEYTGEQLKKFKTGTRKNGPNGIMEEISQKMSDEEIQAVSNYVSGLH